MRLPKYLVVFFSIVSFYPKVYYCQAQEFKFIKAEDFSIGSCVEGKKGAVLIFWTTWCPHCRAALRDAFNKEAILRTHNIGCVLINAGEPKVTVERFLGDRVEYCPVVLDRDLQISRGFGIIGVPTLIFLDSEGKILKYDFRLPPDFLNLFENK